MSALAAPPSVWPYHGRYPRRCRVVAGHHRRGFLGLALAPGVTILAGSQPHLCRPAAAYLVEFAGRAGVQVKVVYSAGGGRMIGRRFWWGRVRLEAAWRLGDVRVVTAWQPPVDDLYRAKARLLGHAAAPGGDVPAVAQAAIAAGG